MDKKWKKTVKKITICIASALMILSGVTSQSYALTGTTNSKIYKTWVMKDNDENEHGIEGHLFVDDTEVYCVDFYTDFHRGKTVTAGTYKDIGLSEEKAKRLAVIAYYGHKVSGRTGNDWYAITQGLLWREIHETDDTYFVSNPTAPDLKTTKQCWNEILADVDRYYTAPSFAKTTQSVDSDGSITLTDENGVLKDMEVVKDGGLDVTISNNKLTIKGSTEVNNANIVLRKKVAASEMGTTIIYTSNDCQAVGSFKISDPFQSSLSVKVNQYGKLELTKYNDDKSATIADTTYHITGVNDYDTIISTDENGMISLERLLVGEYKAVETQAADGYLINVSEKSFTIQANETTLVDFCNDEPVGQIQLTKTIDTSKTNELKGDASLEGVTYSLYAKNTVTNKAGTKTYYDKDELVFSQKTDKDGKITWENIPLGDYYIKETKSNDSLVLNKNTIDVSLDYENQTVQTVTSDISTSDRVNMQKIQIFKSGENEGISGLVKGLQGAEFTWKLKSEVDHVGWDDATTYAVITTDEDGKASTPYLPFGEYLVKETKTPADYITAPDFTISVTDDYSEYEDVEQVKRININNKPFTSLVKLVKVDKDSGKRVTLNSAIFKIKNSNGDYVVQKVSGQKFNTFTTNSKSQVVGVLSSEGEVTLPLALDAGTYTVEEIHTPTGFLDLEEPVQFTITNQYDYDVDEDEQPILTVKIQNAQPKGKIILTKTDKVTAQPLENVEYVLNAKEDIISPIDGTVLYNKGETVSQGKTNAEGQIVIENLSMGHYELKETLTNEGYVLSEDVHDIIFEQQDSTTKEYIIDVNVTNVAPSAEIHLVKKDKDTNELLSGVVFKLTAKEDIYSLDGRNTLLYSKGESITDEEHPDGLYVTDNNGEINILNLPLGEYSIKEVKSLEGYISNSETYDVDLSYDHSDSAVYSKYLEIQNTMTKVEVTKIDQVNNQVIGATLQVLDDKGEIVDEWITDGSVHKIYGKLSAGKEYTLHEVKSPGDYYEIAKDQVFTVSDKDLIIRLTMIDIKYDDVGITKYDATNSKELPGAHLEVRDEKGNIIDEWISNEEQHIIKLKVGSTYTLTETIAPDGYAVSETITFTVDDNGEVVQQVKMYDDLLPAAAVVNTGDSSMMMAYGILLVLSTIVLIGLKYKKKNKN